MDRIIDNIAYEITKNGGRKRVHNMGWQADIDGVEYASCQNCELWTANGKKISKKNLPGSLKIQMGYVKKHCDCGYEFAEGMRYCPYCGKKRRGM